MTLIRHFTSTRGSRLLAVLALLCVFGWQPVDVSHNHAEHAGIADCLACNSTSAAAPGSVVLSLPPVTPAHTPEAADCQSPNPALVHVYESRGPPHFS